MSSDKNAIIKEIIALFRLERYIYLGGIVICLIIFITSVIMIIFSADEKPNYNNISILVTSFGGLGVFAGRILKMFDRAMDSVDNK